MYYSVSHDLDSKEIYISIHEKRETVNYINPIAAMKMAFQEKNIHFKNDEKVSYIVSKTITSKKSVRVLKTKFFSKILTWANNEYKALPKCDECDKILNRGSNHTDFPGSDTFCSSVCSVSNANAKNQKMNDNEESEFFLG